MVKRISISVFVALVSAAAVIPAHALNTRTWISGGGVDQAGCGSIANPCRSLQYAHDQTASAGEIDVKDSAGYGSVTITKAITIVGDGSLSGVLAPAGGNAITVNAPQGDIVILRNLAIEGAGSGTNGIVFNSGGKLDIGHCTVQGFVGSGTAVGNGILLQPTSGTSVVLVSDTTLSHNGGVGLFYYPTSGSATTSLLLRELSVSDSRSGAGVAINSSSSSGSVAVLISSSVASDNSGPGFFFSGSNIQASLDLASAFRNSNSGFLVLGGANVTIGRSVGANNTSYGLNNGGGTISSFGDNRFSGNSSGATFGTIGTATLR